MLVPPSRRRPIPTTPAGGRPKVAGLHRRASEPAVDEVVGEDVAADEAALDEGVLVEGAADEAVVDDGAVEESELKAPKAVEWTPPVAAKPKAAKPKSPKPEKVELDKAEAPALFGSKPGWLLPAALLLVAVLLGGLGTFFLVKSRSVSYDAALVDSATTSAVNGQIREAVEKSFSYNFADVESTEKAARELLTGKALCQYNAVFGPVKEVAPQQKLVVTVRVVSSAVSSLKDGKATVLVFADQVTTRTTDNQSGGGTAMLRVSAVDDGGRWKIDNMEMFGATAEQNRQMQGC
jgi:Mce-associated membrane protein